MGDFHKALGPAWGWVPMDRRKESLYHQSVLALKVGMAVLGRDASCASRLPTEKTRQGHLPCMCKILI